MPGNGLGIQILTIFRANIYPSLNMDYQAGLRNFKPEHEYFIGIDSDGCVFDSMEVKQKEFFIPAALRHFRLFPVSRIVRETWEFVNLYSSYRGGNRFNSLIKVFEFLAERKEITESGIQLPDLTALKEWVRSETKLGNAVLRKYYELRKDKSLENILKWSEEVNAEIAEWLHDIPPFLHAAKAIRILSEYADIVVVSQTPLEALEKEWFENDLKRYVRFIAAQEHGTKAEHLALAAKGKYPLNRILMIGDAPGDLNAAKSNGMLFYPIVPGNEERSWETLINEGYNKFLEGYYSDTYEAGLISKFRTCLPEKPPWQSKG